MSDLISRQAAIDAVREYPDDLISQLTAIEDLPFVEPEIIRCKDCKHWNELLNICDRTKRLALGVNGFCSMAERRSDGR